MTVPEKYFLLMNGELDGVNTPEQSAELREYLERDPEGARYYAELRAGLDLLEEVGPALPPADLERDVMAVVDPEDSGGTRRPFAAVVGGALRGLLRPAPGFAFAAGLLIGVLILSSILERPGRGVRPAPEDLFGAILTELGHETAAVPISAEAPGLTVAGEARRAGTTTLVDVAIEAAAETRILLTYDAAVTCEGYLVTGEGRGPATVEPGRFEATIVGRRDLQVLLDDPDRIGSELRLQLFAGGRLLDELALPLHGTAAGTRR